MSLNVDDYFRTAYERRLRAKVSLPDLRTGDTRKLDKLEEVKDVEHALGAQREEFGRRMEGLRRRGKELDEKEGHLKDSLFQFNKFLKENDAKHDRALKKAFEEKELAQQKQAEAELLEQEVLALRNRREKTRLQVQRKAVYRDFLHRVTKSSAKFGEIWELVARFDTLLTAREQLLGRQGEGQRLREALRQQHRRFVDEQGDRILRYNNQLSELRTQLERARSLTLKREAAWNQAQSASARETLLLGRIKVTTLNLFRMIGGQTDDESGVGVGDTLGQLDRPPISGNIKTADRSSSSFRTEREFCATSKGETPELSQT